MRSYRAALERSIRLLSRTHTQPAASVWGSRTAAGCSTPNYPSWGWWFGDETAFGPRRCNEKSRAVRDGLHEADGRLGVNTKGTAEVERRWWGEPQETLHWKSPPTLRFRQRYRPACRIQVSGRWYRTRTSLILFPGRCWSAQKGQF